MFDPFGSAFGDRLGHNIFFILRLPEFGLMNTPFSTKKLPQITLDSLSLTRVDLIKIDVESMEEDVPAGAVALIEEFKPIMFIEVHKFNRERLYKFLTDRDFIILRLGKMDIIAVHNGDSVLEHLQADNGELSMVIEITKKMSVESEILERYTGLFQSSEVQAKISAFDQYGLDKSLLYLTYTL